MIYRLRRRFIVIAMVAITAVLAIIMTAVNIMNYSQILSDADEKLATVSDNRIEAAEGRATTDSDSSDNAEIKEHMEQKKERQRDDDERFFFVTLSEDGTVEESDTNFVSQYIDEEDAGKYAKEAFASGSYSGEVESFRFLRTDDDDDVWFAFLDISQNLSSARSFLLISVMFSVAGVVIVFFIVFILSKRAVRPIAESYEKQKQFITNSSHELKTPVSVILSSAEVLEMETGENKWIDTIKDQSAQMSRLIADLVSTAKMGESLEKHELFSLSDAVADTSGQFRSRAMTRGLEFSEDIRGGLTIRASEAMLRRLVSILVDNAVKYSDGSVSVRLSKAAAHMTLTVTNSASADVAGDTSRYFDRFYRSDTARASSESGFGIGLSTAKTICDAHCWRISAVYDGKNVVLTVTF